MAAVTAKEQFLRTFEREVGTTVKVLKALPADQAELKPAEMCRSARELAWIFVVEQGMTAKALTTGFDWSQPSSPMPPAPDSMVPIVTAFEQGAKQVADLVRSMPDDQLDSTVQFPTGPGKMGNYTKQEFLWFLLSDQIHHRGQFSIYLRMAGGKVPSIYGPTADEPWM
jgi:uncharacterized damage-inducible protein DinB